MLKVKTAKQAKIILCIFFIVFCVYFYITKASEKYINDLKYEIMQKLKRETNYEVTLLKESRNEPLYIVPKSTTLEEIGQHLGKDFVLSRKNDFQGHKSVVYIVKRNSEFFQYLEVVIEHGIDSKDVYLYINGPIEGWYATIFILNGLLMVYCLANYKNIYNVLKEKE